MNYLSIDVETTGLDPFQDQILEFCAIADDWQTPLVNCPTLKGWSNATASRAIRSPCT